MASPDLRQDHRYRLGFMLVTGALLALALLRMLAPLWSALAWAAFLAFLVYPLHRRLSARLRGRAGVSAGLLTLLTPFVILGPLVSLGIVFATQVGDLVQYLRGASQGFHPRMLYDLERIPAIGRLLSLARANLSITADQIQGWIMSGAENLLKTAAALGGNLFVGAVGTIFGFIVMLFLLFFFLRDGRGMLERAVRFVPLEETRRRGLLVQLGKVMRAVVYGSGLTALIQGFLVGVGWALVGLKAPVVFGVLAALAAFIPSVGTGIVMVPAILWLLVTQRWGAAIFMGVWAVGVGFSDNLLRPAIVARQTEVPALAVFVGAIGGVAAFGFIGLFLGPLLLVLIGTLLGFAEEALGGPR